MLRGYPFGADKGDLYWLGTAEYRFPIWQIQRGVGTIPAYVRHIAGAVFIDTGNAFLSPAQSGQPGSVRALGQAAIEDPLVGVGAELQLRSVLLWADAVSGRLGYAVGIGPYGYKPEYGLYTFYFQLGSSF